MDSVRQIELFATYGLTVNSIVDIVDHESRGPAPSLESLVSPWALSVPCGIRVTDEEGGQYGQGQDGDWHDEGRAHGGDVGLVEGLDGDLLDARPDGLWD